MALANKKEKMDHEYKEPYQLKLKKLKDLATKSYHDVSCPKCQGNILGDGININDKIAKCDNCGVVFSFQKEINQLTKPQKIKQEIIRPEGIDLFYFKEELDITIQQPYSVLEAIWGTMTILLALLFTFLAFAKFGTFPFTPAIISWLLSAYPIYSWITHSKQKMYVSINEQLMNIEWRPKKGIKNQSYDRQDIDQLYIKQNIGMGYYEVYMILNGHHGQKHVRLIPGLDSKTKARYLEQEVEKYLGTIDREVLEESK